MVGCGVFGVVSCIAMVLVSGSDPTIRYGVAALVGAVLFPIYGLNVAHANDLAAPTDYVETSSGMMITYGVGTISGPLMVGPVMDYFGPRPSSSCSPSTSRFTAPMPPWRIAQRNETDGMVSKTDFQPSPVPQPGLDPTGTLQQAAAEALSSEEQAATRHADRRP